MKKNGKWNKVVGGVFLKSDLLNLKWTESSQIISCLCSPGDKDWSLGGQTGPGLPHPDCLGEEAEAAQGAAAHQYLLPLLLGELYC